MDLLGCLRAFNLARSSDGGGRHAAVGEVVAMRSRLANMLSVPREVFEGGVCALLPGLVGGLQAEA
eukprot:8727789-Lingulodinium_polyedra.AAC.1